MATETHASTDKTALFNQLDDYVWDEDDEFQGGLRAILGSVQNPDQVEHLTLRAKCYYYARKSGQPVDFDGYKQWVESRKVGDASIASVVEPPIVQAEVSPSNPPSGIAEAPKPATFAEICDLIAEGKPIPGIKDIPDTILEGQASENQAEKRRKPWEKAATSGDEKPSWMT